ncbi:hypothetical protein M422DRAFT_39652 [Sphaerobolus stellatus SS14]|uniref:Uncharacterized protein n=1 Tax=Sphaerobolus stellatus (strain SS14) TaxID=990650 RepID=A0A0C9U2R5_SPHS4|nr:hypothetical protein M422DRAFT_39652 [Sphaerobolus stellatus SS14]
MNRKRARNRERVHTSRAEHRTANYSNKSPYLYSPVGLSGQNLEGYADRYRHSSS